MNLLRSLDLCSSLPSSFPLQATFELEVARAPGCLPSPSRLANLRSLNVRCLDWNPPWLRTLSTLPLLGSMELTIAQPPTSQLASPPTFTPEPGAFAGRAMLLPRLPVLRVLKAHLEPGCPPLRMLLDHLPRLELGRGQQGNNSYKRAVCSVNCRTTRALLCCSPRRCTTSRLLQLSRASAHPSILLA